MFLKHFTTVTILLLSFSAINTEIQAQSWTELTATGTPPSIRAYHSAIYDIANNQMIVFGGQNTITANNEVWVLSTANGLGGTPAWNQLFPTGGTPTSRTSNATVYDNTNNRMIIFGGQSAVGGYLNDVWVLSTANGLGGTPNWIQLSPTGSAPTTRYGHSGVYNPASNQLIIFGGYIGGPVSTGVLNDVWVLSHANGLGGTPAWTQLSPTGSAPTTRYFHTAIYDTTINIMIIFGGYSAHGDLSDVWILSNANGLDSTTSAWTQLSPSGSPPITRNGHTTIYDDANNRMILFGGYNGGSTLRDVWVLSHPNGLGGTPAWTQLSPTGSILSTRCYHSAVYDPANNKMIIFGGNDGNNYLNDTWVLDNANGLLPINDWTLYSSDLKSSSIPNHLK